MNPTENNDQYFPYVQVLLRGLSEEWNKHLAFVEGKFSRKGLNLIAIATVTSFFTTVTDNLDDDDFDRIIMCVQKARRKIKELENGR